LKTALFRQRLVQRLSVVTKFTAEFRANVRLRRYEETGAPPSIVSCVDRTRVEFPSKRNANGERTYKLLVRSTVTIDVSWSGNRSPLSFA